MDSILQSRRAMKTEIYDQYMNERHRISSNTCDGNALKERLEIARRLLQEDLARMREVMTRDKQITEEHYR